MPQNRAAFLEEHTKPLVVRNASYYPPNPREIVIENHAVAINPVDWHMRDSGYYVESYPTVCGCDVAGKVIAVGKDVKEFQVGDRVTGQAMCLSLGPKYGAFQSYVPCPVNVACKIPNNISFASACALPLSVNTAALALFPQHILGLRFPSLSPPSSKKIVMIYGGSTSVGSSAIQLAKAAGAQVIAVASESNWDYCRALGADHLLDYKKQGWVDQAISLVSTTGLTGIFDTISKPSSLEPISKIVASVSAPVPIATTIPAPAELNLKSDNVFGANIVFDETLSKAIWFEYLPQALEKGALVPKPDSRVVGKGLEDIQAAIDVQKKGVSAQKVVVELL